MGKRFEQTPYQRFSDNKEAYEKLSDIICHSVQFSRSVVPNSLRPHESQHTRPPCPSPTPRFHPNPSPSSQ